MQNQQNLAIGLLSLTAVVLFCTLVLVGRQPAYAASGPDMGGDYKLISGSIAGSQDYLAIIDGTQMRMVVLTYDPSRKRMRPVVGFTDLGKAFKLSR